jgi:hypothetical protein
MKRIIRLTESDLARIVKRVIKENEEEWISQSEDMEMDSDFSKMEMLKQNEDFLELVDMFKKDPEMAKDIQRTLEHNVNESYKYYDYGDNKKEITKNHFLKRKLITYGIASLVSGILGYTMGVMSGDDILQAALLMAGMGGAVWGTLASEVGREKVKDEEEPINEMEDEDFMIGADRNWEDREEYDPRFYAPSPDYEEGEEWGEKEYDHRFYAPSPDYEEDDDDYSGLKDVHRKWYDQNMGKHKEDRDEDDDYKDRSMYSPYYGDDKEWGERDMGEESLQDLIEEARDILENELGFSIDAINEMDEFDIVDALHDHMYDELAYDIEHLMEKEGF